MASNSLERAMKELGGRVDEVQDWIKTLSQESPVSKYARSYLPRASRARNVGLPTMIALGGLAFIGALTLLAASSQMSTQPAASRKSGTEHLDEEVSQDRIEVDDLKPLK